MVDVRKFCPPCMNHKHKYTAEDRHVQQSFAIVKRKVLNSPTTPGTCLHLSRVTHEGFLKFTTYKTPGKYYQKILLIRKALLRRQRQRKRRLKIYVRVTCTHRGYSNSFNLYNVAELSWNRIGRSDVQAETENEKFAVM